MPPNGMANIFISPTETANLVGVGFFSAPGNSLPANKETTRTELSKVSGNCAMPPLKMPSIAPPPKEITSGRQMLTCQLLSNAGCSIAATVTPKTTSPNPAHCHRPRDNTSTAIAIAATMSPSPPHKELNPPSGPLKMPRAAPLRINLAATANCIPRRTE